MLFISFNIALFAFAYRNLFGTGMLAYHDLAPFPEHATDAFKLAFSAWNPRTMGVPQPEPPLTFVTGILLWFSGDNGPLVQKIFWFSLMPIASITMYIFLGRFVKSQLARFVASLIYSINRHITLNFIAGSTSTLTIYAFQPLVLYFLVDLLEKGRVCAKPMARIRSMFLFSIASALPLLIGSDKIVAIFWPMVAVFFFLYIPTKSVLTSIKYILTTIGFLVVSFILSMLQSMRISPWNLSIFFPKEGFLVGYVTSSINSLIGDVIFCYNYPPANLVNLLRLAWEEYVRGFIYNGDPYSTLFGFFLPLLAFPCLLLARSRKSRRYAVGFSTVAIFTILFLWLTHLGITLDLFRLFPALFIYRFPSILLFTVLLAYCPMIAITLDEIVRISREHYHRDLKPKPSSLRFVRHTKALAPVILLCIILVPSLAVYNWTFLTGDMALSRVYGSDYSIPSVYKDVTDWIEARKGLVGSFRVLWLPWDYKASLYLFRTNLNIFNIPFGAERFSQASSLAYVNSTIMALIRGFSNRMGVPLAIANVKYIVVNLASSSTGDLRNIRGEILGDPKDFIKILDRQEDLILVAKEKDFVVYENNEFVSHVAIYDRAFFVLPNSNENSANDTKIIYGWKDDNFMTGWAQSITPYQISNYSRILDNGTWTYKATFTIGEHGYWAHKYALESSGLEPIDTNAWRYIALQWKSESNVVRAYVHYTDGYIDWILGGNGAESHEGNWEITVFALPYGKMIDFIEWGLDNQFNATVTSVETSLRSIQFYSKDDISYGVIPSIVSMSYLPGFKMNNQALIFGSQLSPENWGLNNSEVAVFLGDINETLTNIKLPRNLVFIYTALKSLTLVSGNWSTISSIETSNLFLPVFQGKGEASKEFLAPRNGFYGIALRASTNGTISFKVDERTVDKNESELTGNKKFEWFETNSFYLESGQHKISLFFDGNITQIDDMIIFSALQKNMTLADVVSSHNDLQNFSSREISWVEYQVDILGDKPVFIVLGETYDPDWNARIDGENIKHFKGFLWANGFYIDQYGKSTIKINFDQQATHNLIIILAVVAWLFPLAVILYTSNLRISLLTYVKKHARRHPT